MIPILYLSELLPWLKSDLIWSKWDKIKLVLWLASWPYSLAAIIFLIFTSGYLYAGIYALNFLALWLFQPAVVKNHSFKWKRDYDFPY